MSIALDQLSPTAELQDWARGVVTPMFEALSSSVQVGKELPPAVVRRRRDRAIGRLVEALASRGACVISEELRDALRRLIVRWSEKGFDDGWPEAEAFEVRCEHDAELIQAEASGDHERIQVAREGAHRRLVLERHGKIELRGLGMSARVYQDLDVAYVPLFIEDPTREIEQRIELPSELTTSGKREGKKPGKRKGKGKTTSKRPPTAKTEVVVVKTIPRTSAVEVVGHHARLIIVGAPGSGKTTLLAYLATRAAQGGLASEAKGVPEGVVPLVVPVRSLGADVLTLATLSAAAECTEALARDLLSTGRALVLIDGLDEASGGIDTLLPSIEQLSVEFSASRFVATTRPASSDDQKRVEVPGFVSTRMLPMTRDEVYAFIDRWCLAAERHIQKDAARAEAEAHRAADDLKARVKTSRPVERLAQTPLMCSVLCIVHRFLGQRIPERRATLYEACTNVLLYDWDRTKFPEGSAIGQLDATAKRYVLCGLARWMHDRHESEASQADVVARLCERLGSVNRSANDAERILAEIRDRSGVLVERRPGFWAFSHLTFQEYLTALEYVRAGDTVRLVEFRDDRWWHEVIPLAAGVPGARAEVLVRGLLDADASAKSEGTLLAAQCVETAVDLTPALRTEVEHRISQLLPRTEENARRLAGFGDVVGAVLLRELQSAEPLVQCWIMMVMALIDYELAADPIGKLAQSSVPVKSAPMLFPVGILLAPELWPEAHFLISSAITSLASLANSHESAYPAFKSTIHSSSNWLKMMAFTIINIRQQKSGSLKELFFDVFPTLRELAQH